DGVAAPLPEQAAAGELGEHDGHAIILPMADRIEPATMLLHKPAGFDTISGRKPAAGLVEPATRWPDDPSGMALLERHFHRLTPLVPLDAEASGLMVLTQDGRI